MVKPYPKLSKANSICKIGFVLIFALIIIYAFIIDAHTSLPHWLPRLLLFLELGFLIASLTPGSSIDRLRYGPFKRSHTPRKT